MFFPSRQSTIACGWHMLHYSTLDMSTKLQRKSSAPYNDLNATRFFCLLLMHFNGIIIYIYIACAIYHIDPLHCKRTLAWSLCNSRDLTDSSYRNLKRATNVEDICLSIPNILQTLSVHIRILMFKKVWYHDAVYDTCYFNVLWKIPHKWSKKARYHDAVYNMCHFVLFWK